MSWPRLAVTFRHNPDPLKINFRRRTPELFFQPIDPFLIGFDPCCGCGHSCCAHRHLSLCPVLEGKFLTRASFNPIHLELLAPVLVHVLPVLSRTR